MNELFRLLKARNNRDDLHELVTSDTAYQSVDNDTAIVMSEYTDIKLPRRNKEGKYNMCKAILDLEKKSADRALVEAIRNTMRNTQNSFEDVCKMLGIAKVDIQRYKKMI